MGTSHTHVLFEWEYLGFVLEVVYGCGVCAACCNSECHVFCGLEFLSVCFCDVWVPGWMGVGEDWADELFVDLCDVFLGVTIRGGCKSSEDVQAGLCLSFDLVNAMAKTRLNVLRALTTTFYGHSKENITQVYKQFIRSVLTYAHPAWHPDIAETHTKKLQTT